MNKLQSGSKNAEDESYKWPLIIYLGLITALALNLALVSPIASAQNDLNLPENKLEKINSIEENEYVYIFCNPLTDPRVKKLIQGAEAPAKLFDLEVKYFGPEKAYDADEVLAILRQVIDQSPKGIAMEIGHPSKFDAAIGRAVKEGIYFVSFSIDDWTDNPRQGHIGYNWEKVGTDLADELLGDLPPNSNVLLLDSSKKRGRTCHLRTKSTTKRLNEYNFNYHIMDVKPEKDDIEAKVLNYVENNDVDGIISLWEVITEPLAQVVAYNDLQSLRIGGIGFGRAEKYVKTGSFDVITEIETRLEGGIPLETLYYSAQYDVIPGTYHLHVEPISTVKKD
jgi:ABC-type sugar transport system substrate-binding protein